MKTGLPGCLLGYPQLRGCVRSDGLGGALLPHGGRRLIEVGAGFGRLADEYGGFGEIVLLDFVEVHVAAARASVGIDPRVVVTLGDALELPFPDGTSMWPWRPDAASLRRPGAVLAELAELFAGRRPGPRIRNKRNLKSIARWLPRRSSGLPSCPGGRVQADPLRPRFVSVRRSLRAAGSPSNDARFALPTARPEPAPSASGPRPSRGPAPGAARIDHARTVRLRAGPPERIDRSTRS